MYNSNGTLKPLIKLGLFIFGIFVIMGIVQYFLNPVQNIKEEKIKVTLVSDLSLLEVEKPIGEIDTLNFQSNMWKSNLKSATETYSLVENYDRNLNKLYVLKNDSPVPVEDANEIFANLEPHHIDEFRCYSANIKVYCIYSSPTGWTSSSDWTTFTSESTDFKVYEVLDDKLSYVQTIQSRGQNFPQLLTSDNKTYASFGNSVYYLNDKRFVPVTGIDYERINKNFGLNPDVQYVNGEWFLVFDGSLIDNNSEVYVLHDSQSQLFDELSSNRYVDFFSVDNNTYVKVNKVTSGFCGDDPCYKTTYFQVTKTQ